MLFERLQENPYAWAFLSLCTIASLFLAVWALIKGKRKMEFSYYRTGKNIVKGGRSLISDLRLLYKEKVIDDLSITRFAIWNSGSEVLKHSDIVETNALQIIADNDSVKILDAIIIKQSDTSNRFLVEEKNDKVVKFSFNYANKQDGIVVQIIHTGEASSLKLGCKIKGGSAPKKIGSIAKQRRHKRWKKPPAAVLVFLCIIEIILSVIGLLGVWEIIKFDDTTVLDKLIEYENYNMDNVACDFRIIASVLFIGYIIWFLITSWKILKQKYYVNIPNTLRNDLNIDDSL